jgi:uncharacterized protein YbjT (DUF2867 family)
MILITGGTGFVGTNLIRRMRKEGLPVRSLVRNPDKARALQDLGVELVQGDIADKASLEKAAAGVERVVHLVGIIQEARGATFRDVHVEGTRNVLEAAKKAGVRHFFHQSALGTRAGAMSAYHKTKWAAEELVRASAIPYTILRPSLIYGPGDLFTVRVTEMIKLSPVLPIIGPGTSKIQPIFIDDVVACIVKAVTSDAFLNKTYEIGGPEQLTYEAVFRAVSDALNIHRSSLHIPLAFMKPLAGIFETVLPKPPMTTDQLIMLQEDNVCGMQDIRDIFGIYPITFQEGLKRFMRASS